MKPIYRPKFGRSQIHAEPAGFYQPVDDAGVPAVVLGVADRYGEISYSSHGCPTIRATGGFVAALYRFWVKLR